MSTTATPEVLWAQRSSSSEADKNFVYLTISVPDVPKDKLKLDLKPQGLTFDGPSDTLKKHYHVELEFYAEVDVEESKINHTAKNVEIKLQKKDLQEEYWPRLLKDSKRMHFLKTDFDKWVDEDEQNEAPEEDFSQFGGMGGMPGMGGAGGMPGMEGMGGMPGMGGAGGDFGGIDFSKLGGEGGMGGMDLASMAAQMGAGGAGGPGFEEEGDDDGEDDMPALEGEDDGKAAAGAKDAPAPK